MAIPPVSATFFSRKIQLFQDKILLYEFSGDALFASRTNRGTLNQAYMENRNAGFHNGSATSIAAAAAPPRIRLEIPFPGVNGFPSIAMRAQSFKLRLELRRLEEIVESSTGLPCIPWELPALQTSTGTFTPLIEKRHRSTHPATGIPSYLYGRRDPGGSQGDHY
jgi:hypothetical protein